MADGSDKRPQSPCPSCGATFEGQQCACGWRRSWREPKKRADERLSPHTDPASRLRARARERLAEGVEAADIMAECVAEWLAEPAPDRDGLVDESLRVLRGIMRGGPGILPKDQVAAAQRVLEWAKSSVDFAAELERMLGNPEAALDWVEKIAHGLREKIAAKALPAARKGRGGDE